MSSGLALKNIVRKYIKLDRFTYVLYLWYLVSEWNQIPSLNLLIIIMILISTLVTRTVISGLWGLQL